MADDLATIGYEANMTGLNKLIFGMKDLGRQGNKTEKSLDRNSKGMSRSFALLAGAAAAAATAVAALSKTTEISRQFDVLNAQLITATGSAANAAIAFEALQEFAATTPYDLQQTVRAFNQLVNLGLTPSEAALQSYGNTAAAMGKDLSQLVEAVADATTGELERLKEFGIKAKSEGDNVSFTFRGVTKTIGKNAAEIEDYLMALGENEFAGAMEERANTLDGALSNLGDTWDNLFLTISQKGVGSLIEDSVRAVTDGIQYIIDVLNSGVISHVWDTLISPFDGIIESISVGFNFLSGFIAEATSGWWESFKNFEINLHTSIMFIPKTISSMVKRIGIELSALGGIALVYGDLFLQTLKLSFQKTIDMAGVYVKKLVSVINPMSDEYDLTSGLSQVSAEYSGMFQDLNQSASTRVSLIMDSMNAETGAIKANLQEQKDSYKQRLTMSDDIIQSYIDEKNAINAIPTDKLKQFKITPSTEDGGVTSDGINDADNGFDDLTNSYLRWISSVEDAVNPTAKLQEEVYDLWDAMLAGDIDDSVATKRISQLEEEIDRLSADKPAKSYNDMVNSVANGSVTMLSSIKTLADEGSKEYEKLALAIQSVQIAQALMTGNFLGAAAGGVMLLSSLIDNDFEDVALKMQESQGLNEWNEKASSIDDSVALVANATEDLVGINTDMLKALTTLQSSILSAAGIVARDVETPTVDVSGEIISDPLRELWTFGDPTGISGAIYDFFDTFSLGLLSFVGGLLGGSSKITDEGIRIIGGTLGEMMDETMVLAYQSVSYKKWALGKKKTKTNYKDISDDVGAQFELIFTSMADAVAEGASVLGMDMASVEDTIQNFVIDSFNVSLKGLSVDEQAAALEDVFSQIFNDLTAEVVPWLVDLQDVGEDLAETLSRVATQVSIADYFVDVFGTTFGDKMADPEAYAKAVDNLTDLVGGIEELSDKTNSFISAFATDAQKFEMHSNALNDAFNEVGLTLPSTSKEMYDLMGALDGSTEAGQKQIATLLNMTDTAEQYYRLQESTLELADSFADAVMDIYDVSDAITQVSLDAAIAAARMGDLSLAEQLDTSDYNLDAADFATAAEYNIAQAQAANKLIELSQLTASSVGSVDSQQLEVLNDINKNIVDSIKETNELLRQQNRLQADSADYLDRIDRKTEAA